MTGEVGILNVGAGDTKLIFDPNSPQDMIRAARIVKDMLRRGYALLVEVKNIDGQPSTYRRAYDFDEKTCEYIIADLDPVAAEKADNEETAQEQASETVAADKPETKRTKAPGKLRVHASKTRTVAVARTAGG